MVLTHTSSKKACSVAPLRQQPRRKVSSKSSAPSSAYIRAPRTMDTKSPGKKREPSKPLAVPIQPRNASKCLTSPERLIRMTGALDRWKQFQNDQFVVLFDQIVARCALCKEDFVLCERSEYDWLHWQGHLRRCMNGTAGRQRTSKKSEAWLRAFKKKADARMKELEMSHTSPLPPAVTAVPPEQVNVDTDAEFKQGSSRSRRKTTSTRPPKSAKARLEEPSLITDVPVKQEFAIEHPSSALTPQTSAPPRPPTPQPKSSFRPRTPLKDAKHWSRSKNTLKSGFHPYTRNQRMPTPGPSSARVDPTPSRFLERTTHAPRIPRLQEVTTSRHTLDASVGAGRQLVRNIDTPPVGDSPAPQGIRQDATTLKTEEKKYHVIVDEPPRYTFPPPPPPPRHAHVNNELYELCEYFVRNVGADLKPRS